MVRVGMPHTMCTLKMHHKKNNRFTNQLKRVKQQPYKRQSMDFYYLLTIQARCYDIQCRVDQSSDKLICLMRLDELWETWKYFKWIWIFSSMEMLGYFEITDSFIAMLKMLLKINKYWEEEIIRSDFENNPNYVSE